MQNMTYTGMWWHVIYGVYTLGDLMRVNVTNMIGTAKHLFVESYLQITNRCVHTVATQELTRYRELLERFVPRSPYSEHHYNYMVHTQATNINISVQFQNIALCKKRGKDQPVILTDEWPNFSCTAVFQPWTSTLCFPTRNQV